MGMVESHRSKTQQQVNMLDYEAHNDALVWWIKEFNSKKSTPYKNTIDKIDTFFVVSTMAKSDDMGGLSNDYSQQLEDNTQLVSISPYIAEGNFSNKFVAKILLSDDEKLLDIKDLCETYPDKTFYFTMGISTFPLNDKNISYENIINKLTELNVDNLHICFVNGWDMYTDSYREFNRLEKMIHCFRDWPHTKLKFLMCNNKIVRTYRKAFPDADVQYYTIYHARIFDSPGKKSFPKRIVEKSANQRRKKKLICLNNFEKRHRTEVVDVIERYKDDIFYSYRQKDIYLEKEITPKFKRSFDHNFMRNQDSISYRIISNTYSWIANETLFYGNQNPGGEDPNHNGWGVYSDNKQIVEGFITEKTFKAYYYELPVLVVGLPRTYMHLRSLGYTTFPEFWDESFDIEEDDTIRLELIKRQIINYLEKPFEEIHDIFWSKQVQEKLEHNKNIFLNTAKNDPFSSLALKEKYGY